MTKLVIISIRNNLNRVIFFTLALGSLLVLSHELPRENNKPVVDGSNAKLEQDSDDLVKIRESPKAIECLGVKHIGELAPESRVVAVYFGGGGGGATDNNSSSAAAHQQQLANINLVALLSGKKYKQPGKQSQQFDIGQQPTTTPSVELVNQTNNASCDCKQTPTSAATTQATDSSSSSSSSEPISSESSTAATTTAAADVVSEVPSTIIDAPVGTKTARQGDAVHCGEANPNGKSNKRLVLDRIVGGRKTEPGEFPFQVRLNIRSRRGSGICGGVILDRHHILTAAHCMTACASQHLTTATIENGGVHATIGDHSIKSNDGEIELDVEQIVPHEKYDACNFYANDHDIAMIKTSSPIEYRFTTDGYGSINRPCMPKDPELAYREGESVIVSGWGVTRENSGSLSNILRYVQVPVVNTTRCQETYGSRVTKDHVCAGYQSGGKDSCQGDSGGPLVRVVDNRYELVGIVSFGYGCGQPGAPGVYTRVASYIDWIKANLS